jgi:hypothetical protein
MLWNSECHQVRQWLPLLADSDLPLSERTTVERHLRQCSDCRQQLSRTETSLAVLHDVRAARSAQPAGSLWPAIERQLDGIAFRRADSRAGWIPVGALATACAAMLLVGVFGPGFDTLPDTGGIVEEPGAFRASAMTVSERGARYRSSNSPYYSDTDSY